MSDERDQPKLDEQASNRAVVRGDDQLQVEDHSLKQHGDALRAGSGRREGQSPPTVEPREGT